MLGVGVVLIRGSLLEEKTSTVTLVGAGVTRGGEHSPVGWNHGVESPAKKYLDRRTSVRVQCVQELQ